MPSRPWTVHRLFRSCPTQSTFNPSPTPAPPPPHRPATQDLEASSGHALAPPATTLAFRSVTVEGYLSFKEEVTYPLGNRGLVVVTGRVEDTLEAGG